MIKLCVGEVVQVYQKPVSGEEPEGRAVLLEMVREDEGDGLSMWYVRFVRDRFTALRTINAYNAQRE